MYKGGYVYIMTNKNHTVLYTGVTEDIVRRVREHKEHKFKGFTKKYNAVILVYYQYYSIIQEAIEKEKLIKGGSRQRKIDLIEVMNPEWEDLYEKIAL
ncbi:MAG TPA: GIY-YIG nuclease family protein [Bacteroidales bacterium]|nr:GIY-YIG nuclease family protein [Bacteroidales bacterium]